MTRLILPGDRKIPRRECAFSQCSIDLVRYETILKISTSLVLYPRRLRFHFPRHILQWIWIPVGIFLVSLAFAFYFSNTYSANLFMPIFLGGWAVSSSFNNASPGKLKGIYGGLYPFVWLLGLAICFLIGIWPWILVPAGLSLIIFSLEKKWHITTSSQQKQIRRSMDGLWFWIMIAIILIVPIRIALIFSKFARIP